jgi:hypothetical protein
MSRKNLECISIVVVCIVIAAILLYVDSWIITAQETLIQYIGRGWWTGVVLVLVIFTSVRSK